MKRKRLLAIVWRAEMGDWLGARQHMQKMSNADLILFRKLAEDLDFEAFHVLNERKRPAQEQCECSTSDKRPGPHHAYNCTMYVPF